MADGCEYSTLTCPAWNRHYEAMKRITDMTLRSTVNQARAMRILEIMNDFRTVQLHTSSHVSRAQANPPDDASYYHDGYVVMRQCAADAQAILATHFNPGSLGLQAGAAGEGEVQKATMQRSAMRAAAYAAPLENSTDNESRIILDASTRRFQAHKIYLRAAAATRWAQMRQQVLRGEQANGRHANALRAIDARLRDVSYHPAILG